MILEGAAFQLFPSAVLSSGCHNILCYKIKTVHQTLFNVYTYRAILTSATRLICLLTNKLKTVSLDTNPCKFYYMPFLPNHVKNNLIFQEKIGAKG